MYEWIVWYHAKPNPEPAETQHSTFKTHKTKQSTDTTQWALLMKHVFLFSQTTYLFFSCEKKSWWIQFALKFDAFSRKSVISKMPKQSYVRAENLCPVWEMYLQKLNVKTSHQKSFVSFIRAQYGSGMTTGVDQQRGPKNSEMCAVLSCSLDRELSALEEDPRHHGLNYFYDLKEVYQK